MPRTWGSVIAFALKTCSNKFCFKLNTRGNYSVFCFVRRDDFPTYGFGSGTQRHYLWRCHSSFQSLFSLCVDISRWLSTYCTHISKYVLAVANNEVHTILMVCTYGGWEFAWSIHVFEDVVHIYRFDKYLWSIETNLKVPRLYKMLSYSITFWYLAILLLKDDTVLSDRSQTGYWGRFGTGPFYMVSSWSVLGWFCQ